MKKVDIPQIQGRFFGLSYAAIQEIVANLNAVASCLSDRASQGIPEALDMRETVIEAQGVLDDLSAYAEKIRIHESAVTGAVIHADKARQENRRNHGGGNRRGGKRSPRHSSAPRSN